MLPLETFELVVEPTPLVSIDFVVRAVHCLANETDTALHLVEVQSGSYLGEDDIERLADQYGRC